MEESAQEKACDWDERVLRGADGLLRSERGMPSSRYPKGYDSWNNVGPTGNHWAKRLASKLRRKRWKKEVQNDLNNW
jgi:hypothetical protein